MVIGQKRHETKTDKRFYAGRPVDESFVRLYPPSPVEGDGSMRYFPGCIWTRSLSSRTSSCCRPDARHCGSPFLKMISVGTLRI